MGYALSGKTALVTGANRRHGRSQVGGWRLRRGQHEKGVRAAHNMSTLDLLVARHGWRRAAAQLDVTNAAQKSPPPPRLRRTSTSWSTTRASSASSVARSPNPKWMKEAATGDGSELPHTFAVTQALRQYSRRMAAARSPT